MDKKESFSELVRKVREWKFDIISLDLHAVIGKDAYMSFRIGDKKYSYVFIFSEREKGYEIFASYINPIFEVGKQTGTEMAKLFLDLNFSQKRCFWCLKTTIEKDDRKIIGQKSFVDKEKFSPTLFQDVLLEIFTNQMVADTLIEDLMKERGFLINYQNELEKKISKSKLN
jgi:hypothetical protein